ncbi:tyrosine-type recombinase/integrase [Arthrobacter sp. 35/47]|uniref:tyrosine-type recombinase/integrase n=1 Tax=Arthrobacter sp. 35/47 TaxID=269454 RepID=UPI000687A8C8|nr:tyrosine-type recombinase/integrase [Arthrobacter sp. 35/47]
MPVGTGVGSGLVTKYSAVEVPLSNGERAYVVVDSDFTVPEESRLYSLWLSQAGRSINTQRSYQTKLAVFLTWASAEGVDWRNLTLLDLIRYKLNLQTAAPGQRSRSGKTVNVYLVAVLQFLRFCTHEGLCDVDVDRRFFDQAGLRSANPQDGSGDPDRVPRLSRMLKSREATKRPQPISADEELRLMACATNPRDALLIRMMLHSGLRVGEALGLRLEDLHFLPESTHAGCFERGPHVHIHRRINSNGALAKSSNPRSIPVTDEVTQAYAAYQDERYQLLGGISGDYVFVNLYSRNSPPDEPLRYASVHAMFRRWEARTTVRVRPHQLRHTAATRWVRAGHPLDVVQELLGHKSLDSTQVYLHASAEEMRAAVESVTCGRNENNDS